MDLHLPLTIACIIIILALIVFPLLISYKAEKHNNSKEQIPKNLNEWEKIKEYGNKINKKTRNHK